MNFYKYLALIAHDNMKLELVELVRKYKQIFEKYPLVATASTGTMLSEKNQIAISKLVPSGPLGGDQAIGSLVASGNIQAVIFLKDPLNKIPHAADVDALQRLCDLYKIPIATNLSTAEMMVLYFQSFHPCHRSYQDYQDKHIADLEAVLITSDRLSCS